jgi:cobalt-zinc-cadmium efflux system outer membrane protein
MKARLLFFFLILASGAFAQADTLRLSLPDAEKTFLQNNLQLIAGQYNVDAATALVRQARLWDNPTLLTDQNLYDGKFFRHAKTPGVTNGEVYVQVQELIRTAGKIRKLTAVSSAGAKIASLQLDQVLHNLRYALRNDYYLTAQFLSSLSLSNQELVQLNKLLAGMKAQLQAGNISQKDLLRIEALQLSVMQERADYLRQLSDVQSELKTILQVDNNAFISPLPVEIPVMDMSLPMDTLLAWAKENNPDYLLEQANLLYSRSSLRYQQSLRSPDVTVGLEYDKANSYVPNYYGLTVALPLPIVNRNQGNIAAAGFALKQEQSLVSLKEQKLLMDIRNAVQKIGLSLELQQSVDPDFTRKYNQLMQNAFAAYQQRQMSLLDFTDLFEAYKDTQLKYLQQQYNLQKAKEDLNQLTGKDAMH